MADPTVAKGLGNTLILDGLVIIGSEVRRNHGMRTAVTAGTIDAAMTGIIAIQHRSRVNARDTYVAGNTFRLAAPWNTACPDRTADRAQVPVAGDAIAIRRRVSGASVAARRSARVAVVAGGVPCRMKRMYCLR